MIQDEIGIVRQLTGVGENYIQLSDDGFLSRGYVVDGGRVVFMKRRGGRPFPANGGGNIAGPG